MKKHAVVVLILVAAIVLSPLLTERRAFAEDTCQDGGSLCAMLQFLPSSSGGSTGSSVSLEYVDYAGQLEGLGFKMPSSFEGQDWDNYVAATIRLDSVPEFYMYMRDWEESMGYSPFLVDQTMRLTVGKIPYSITVMRGRFDRAAIEEAWRAGGYQPVTINDSTIWKLRGDLEQDPKSWPTLRFPYFNYATFLKDDVIAYSSTALLMNSTILAANGNDPALVADTSVAALLANVPSDLVSAMLVSPDAPGGIGRWAIVGVTSGTPLGIKDRTANPGTPEKRYYGALLYSPEVDLDHKATQVSNEFLAGHPQNTDQSYSYFFHDLNVTVDSERHVVATNFAPTPDNYGSIYGFWSNGGLGFLGV